MASYASKLETGTIAQFFALLLAYGTTEIETAMSAHAAWITLNTTLFPILAQSSDDEQTYTLPWFLILLSVGLGLFVALKPAKREVKVKKAKD